MYQTLEYFNPPQQNGTLCRGGLLMAVLIEGSSILTEIECTILLFSIPLKMELITKVGLFGLYTDICLENNNAKILFKKIFKPPQSILREEFSSTQSFILRGIQSSHNTL